MSNTTEVRKLARKARQKGWTVELTGSGHYMWQHGNGKSFTSSSTPSDYRVIKKIKVSIRQIEAGKDVRH